MTLEQIEQIERGGSNKDSPPPLPSIEQIEQIDPTSDGSKKQPPQYMYWTFTYNNFYGGLVYSDKELKILESILKVECDWFIFQEEMGKEQLELKEFLRKPHINGTIKLKNRQRWSQIHRWNMNIFWQATISVKSQIAYCQKQETRHGDQYIYGIAAIEDVETCKPYGWQLEVMDIIKQKPDNRTIHWYWDKKGGVGKTELCKYLAVHHGAILVDGKTRDISNRLLDWNKKIAIVLYSLSRTMTEYVNYSALEKIKDGIIVSGKYKGGQKIINSPHVFVFSNCEPEYLAMSKDRWHVVEIIM